MNATLRGDIRAKPGDQTPGHGQAALDVLEVHEQLANRANLYARRVADDGPEGDGWRGGQGGAPREARGTRGGEACLLEVTKPLRDLRNPLREEPCGLIQVVHKLVMRLAELIHARDEVVKLILVCELGNGR